MKHAAAEKIFEQLKDMKPEEQLEFWRHGEKGILSVCKGTTETARMAKAA